MSEPNDTLNTGDGRSPDSRVEVNDRSQFRLWQLFASILCFSGAFGLLRISLDLVDRYGGEIFLLFCLATAAVLVVAGVMFLSRWAGQVLARVILWIMEFLIP